MKISVCIITLNEERDLPRCLKSVAPIADEILVVDSGSTDATRDVARQFGARVVEQKWLGYVGQKNFALDRAIHPWVLSIDADEELTQKLATSIARLKSRPDVNDPHSPNGFQVSRIVYYRGRWIRHGDWYPDRLVRLFLRSTARFSGGRVHEKLSLRGKHPLLRGHLNHYTYENAADRAERSARYADLWAHSLYEQGRRAHAWSPVLHALARFIKGFVFKAGFMDGVIGWDIAMGNAKEVWLKYHLLRELQSHAK